MSQRVMLLYMLILITVVGVAYVLLTPEMFKSKVAITTQPHAIDIIKSSAAYQFSVSENEVILLDTKKESWSDTCLDIKIPNYNCTKTKLSGYEAKVNVHGTITTYRSTDDGSLIRVVK